jgi:hypothetical protein
LTHLTNNELVPVALNLNGLHGQLALELSDLAVELCLHVGNCLTVTRELDRVASLGRERSRATACRNLRCLLSEGGVFRNLHAKVATLLESRQTLVARSSQEWVVLGRDVLQTSASGGCVLVDDLLDILLSHLDSEGVTLNLNINSLVQIVILKNLSSLLARNVDTGTSTLGNGLNGRTLLADNSAAD